MILSKNIEIFCPEFKGGFMKISLKDFGGFLSSPDLGKRIAISVLDSLRKEPDVNVIMDFSGVQSVNRHFCEEFLTLVFRGVGYEEFRKKVVMQNQTAVVKLIFDAVINQKKGISVEGINAVIGEPIHTIHIEKQKEEKKEIQIESTNPPAPNVDNVVSIKEAQKKDEERVDEVLQTEPAEEEKGEDLVPAKEQKVESTKKEIASKKSKSVSEKSPKKRDSKRESKPEKEEKVVKKTTKGKSNTTKSSSSKKKK